MYPLQWWIQSSLHSYFVFNWFHWVLFPYIRGLYFIHFLCEFFEFICVFKQITVNCEFLSSLGHTIKSSYLSWKHQCVCVCNLYNVSFNKLSYWNKWISQLYSSISFLFYLVVQWVWLIISNNKQIYMNCKSLHQSTNFIILIYSSDLFWRHVLPGGTWCVKISSITYHLVSPMTKTSLLGKHVRWSTPWETKAMCLIRKEPEDTMNFIGILGALEWDRHKSSLENFVLSGGQEWKL